MIFQPGKFFFAFSSKPICRQTLLSHLSLASTASPCNKIGTTVWSRQARVGKDWRSTFCFDDFSALIFSFSTILQGIQKTCINIKTANLSAKIKSDPFLNVTQEFSEGTIISHPFNVVSPYPTLNFLSLPFLGAKISTFSLRTPSYSVLQKKSGHDTKQHGNTVRKLVLFQFFHHR